MDNLNFKIYWVYITMACVCLLNKTYCYLQLNFVNFTYWFKTILNRSKVFGMNQNLGFNNEKRFLVPHEKHFGPNANRFWSNKLLNHLKVLIYLFYLSSCSYERDKIQVWSMQFCLHVQTRTGKPYKKHSSKRTWKSMYNVPQKIFW